MSRPALVSIKPADLLFLLVEDDTHSTHMSAFMTFQIPAGQEARFVPRVVKAFRRGVPLEPFNRKLRWLSKGAAAWETVEPDMSYHVRHVSVPAPGTHAQFTELVSFLNTSQLDRRRPLWECFVIDGLEGNRFAILLKVHHALIDGEGGLRLLSASLSESPSDKRLRAPWTVSTGTPRAPRQEPDQVGQAQALLRALLSVPENLIGMGSEAISLAAEGLNLKSRRASLPFAAPRTLFNNSAQSSARVFANTELSIAALKAVAKAADASINDVVMTIVDDALHRYLDEQQQPVRKPLVAFMPMALRDESGKGAAAGGNQVSVELIAMGAPNDPLLQRLRRIRASTLSAKDKANSLRNSVRLAYGILLIGSLPLARVLPAFRKVPSANLVISNVRGPAQPLFLGGAPMLAFHGLPALPPGVGLSIFVVSVHQEISLAIGAAPEAVRDPLRLMQLIEQAFANLQREVPASPPQPATVGKKPKAKPKSIAAPKAAVTVKPAAKRVTRIPASAHKNASTARRRSAAR